jgi:hypothetical protein
MTFFLLVDVWLTENLQDFFRCVGLGSMRITDAQRKKLCELIYSALLEIRQLGWDGKSGQAADLADAFHNLPREMWKDDFSLEQFRDLFLKDYQASYPKERIRNYLKQVDQIIAMGADPATN